MSVLALSRGDPSGIGLEIACKAWLAGDAEPFLLVADLDHCRATADALGLLVPFAEATPGIAREMFGKSLPVLPLGTPTRGLPGRPDPADAPGTIRSIER